VSDLFLKRTKRLKVDLGDLKDEKESLSNFLHSKLKLDVTSSGNKVLVDSENLSPKELKKSVNKFIYHKNLMNRYWVGLEKGVVKVNKFKRPEKHEKRKGKKTAPSTIKHGW